jgi:predicted metalloendopeptidase
MRTRKNRCNRVSNYYNTINKEWVDDFKLPETEARTTQAYFIQKEIDEEIAAIIDAEAAKPGPIHDFLRSCDLTDNRIPVGLTPLFNLMTSMRNSDDISSRIGWMNRYGLPAPINVYILGDPRYHKTCRVFIEEGNPNIGIPEYWLYPEYSGHRKAYGRYVNSLIRILGLPIMEHGYASEREFARVYPSVVDRKTRINMSTFGELSAEYSVINWPIVLSAWGLEEKDYTRLSYNVTSPAFLHHLQNRMNRWSIERWQGWFCLIVAQWVASQSPRGLLRNAWFDYARRYLQGRPADLSLRDLRYEIIKANMPNTIGKLWVTKHCDPKMRRSITIMAEKIRDAAATMLSKTSWMSVSTRNAAVRKVRRLDIQICWPEMAKWNPKETSCGLTNRFIDNIMAIAKVSTDENQRLVKSGDCRHPSGESWSRPVFDVNAYYYPDENRFLLPAAILRPPFYDSKKSLVWNYGAIGATIGHEICHAFDSDGRMYDENGDKRDWWTDHDDREYKKKARKVQRLYETREYRDMDVDGELTLIENIADIGGLEFALAGIRLALGRPLTRDELREFFESFAFSWRSKERIKRAAQLLETDPHAPPKLRVNHVVRQMDEWYLAYDIDPGCSDYIKPEHRIHFFS